MVFIGGTIGVDETIWRAQATFVQPSSATNTPEGFKKQGLGLVVPVYRTLVLLPWAEMVWV